MNEVVSHTFNPEVASIVGVLTAFAAAIYMKWLRRRRKSGAHQRRRAYFGFLLLWAVAWSAIMVGRVIVDLVRLALAT